MRFTLDKNAVVEFTVVQVSPVCRFVGRFHVNGHAGANAVPFDGRIRGLQLPPGTYRLIARTGGGAVARLTLVIVDARAPTKDEIASARRSNVCGAGGVDAAVARGTSSGSSSRLSTASDETVTSKQKPSTIVRSQKQARPQDGSATSGDAGVRAIASSLTASLSKATRNPLVIAFLAIAVLLLGLAALPRTTVPDPRATALLETHRRELAVGGAAALAAAVIGLLFV